jgi:hypothetical protein
MSLPQGVAFHDRSIANIHSPSKEHDGPMVADGLDLDFVGEGSRDDEWQEPKQIGC